MIRTTIKREISGIGIGGMTGKVINFTLKPAEVNTGIVFVKKDSNNRIIKAHYTSINDTNLNTSISNNEGDKLFIIEHLLSALWAYSISDIIIEIDGPEVPLMDGSASYFVFLIGIAGLKHYDDSLAQNLYINRNLRVQSNDGQSYIEVEPYHTLCIDYIIDFPEKTIGKDRFVFDSSKMSFLTDISSARTFCTEKELFYRQDFAKGWSVENAVIYGENNIKSINDNRLRYCNEATRHKILDLIGDLMLSGYFIQGKFTCHKSGHYLNSKIVELICKEHSQVCL